MESLGAIYSGNRNLSTKAEKTSGLSGNPEPEKIG
jgi:hypothetical protein